MATFNRRYLGLDPLGEEGLGMGIKDEVLRAQNVPARLFMLGGDFSRSIEGCVVDRHLVCRQVLAHLLGQVACYGAWEDGRVDGEISLGVGTDRLDARCGGATRSVNTLWDKLPN